MAGEKIFVIGF